MRIEWTPKYGGFGTRTGIVDMSGYVHWDDIDDTDFVTIDWLREMAAKGAGTLVEKAQP